MDEGPAGGGVGAAVVETGAVGEEEELLGVEEVKPAV